jgi:hypothetical protein
MKFTSPLALGLCASVPTAKNPIEAILWHARLLVIESGLSRPPFAPAAYAPLRNVNRINERYMEVDGRLIPGSGGFVIELRKDRPHERKNFTCAHELGHTFFYEAVPSIKYRTVSSWEPHHDPEEETLCNIAAAELLMPSAIFLDVASDYEQTPQSLQEISSVFETSLVSTSVQLLKTKAWNCPIILWECDDDEIKAAWLARPNHALEHYPLLNIDNILSSGVYHCYRTGEPTVSNDWMSLNGGFKKWTVNSVRLGANKILTCLRSSKADESPRQAAQAAPLPLTYDCNCDGTRWVLTQRDGHNYVTRCRALTHRKRQPEDS